VKWIWPTRKNRNNTAVSRLKLTSPTQTKGRFYEQLALEYLESQGLQCIAQNFRCKFGEIDLIMQQNDQLIFVEVRYRNSASFGGAGESVSMSKQRKLIRTASYYLTKTKLHNSVSCRFDVICFTQQTPHWIPNAFTNEQL
jgi:putative endonuclease